ncbi:amino acid ABC transporter ATP-binding protein (PAAT family) [Ilumatobacter fluminis]|uniref:Amino acid ABC transporter ATP-binding protein (PAAT family) n=1 Tax=Ilumatobacter fluminis TaxID=467091 RepID=A0A4R7HUM7_9ACTN|nr:amino acid ABC transporter ATP-binding protein [Ilumatobacter fluminis]TDT14651.1 amino acid ABC transporter ATP-binding protein (PAAT family) [Ilumatobacter fluminis]
MTAKLEIRDVHKSYGDKVVLAGMSFDVEEHEVVCLIGPSGSGKSTLLRCIDLLDPLDSGSIHLDGVDITAKNTDANAVRRRVGIVFQSYNLFPHMSVLDNCTLGPRRALGVDRKTAEAKARELLERFGLGEKVEEYPNRISGGQNQRAAIVRALMADPEILLLDEVTSALDPELVGEVLGVIRELAGRGMTMLLATHEMGFARDVADRVCFLHEGRVLEDAAPNDLFGSPEHERTAQFLRRVREAGRI